MGRALITRPARNQYVLYKRMAGWENLFQYEMQRPSLHYKQTKHSQGQQDVHISCVIYLTSNTLFEFCQIMWLY